jgi:hypothetical protein
LLNRKNRKPGRQLSAAAWRPIEILEGRRMLSASAHAAFGGGGHGGHSATIEFSQAPAAVQTGLDNLATADGLTDPTSTQTVYLSNVNGVERYSVDINGTGTQSILTVNQNGVAVTAPTTSATTFGALGTSDSAAATEITAIASALSLTAPASTTVVHVTTTSGGAITYSVHLASSTTGTKGATIAVDSNGNPVGNQTLPFDVLATAIQNGLNTNAPSGATALASTSTQNVKVQTLNGVTTYSTTFTVSGTTTTVTVNSAGTLTSLPSTTSTTFSALPTVAQTELQTLATADGYTGTISSSATISAYDEANGTTIYTITLPVTKTGSDGTSTYTINLTLSVDELGNPTVLPGGGDFGGGDGGCDSGGASSSSSSSSSGTSTASSSASTRFALNGFTYNLAMRRR